jgi:ribosomal-protein-alanine N-acetyltransferase
MLILETERLTLREFVPTDIDDLARTLGDRENMRFYPKPFERADVEYWIDRQLARYASDKTALWAMILKETGQLIGDCGLVRQQVDGATETEIAYHLQRDHQGRGLATEAARACRDHGFLTLGLQRLISLIRPENVPSRRVAERNGMLVEKETIFHDLPHLVYVARP